MQNTRGLKSVEHELKGIRYQSRTYTKLETLMNRVNEDAIREQHRKQSRKKATGTDGVTKDEYGKELDKNAAELIDRMKKFKYKPQPVRRTYIPKANGQLRPLGIPAYEDRLVQGAMAEILNDIYEERFLDCSYGFRPNRSAHDVVKYINNTVMGGKVSCVLEADIKGFFDNVNHDWLMKFLEHDIADKNFLRYVKRFLIAGVMEGTEYSESDKGTPQGGLISPVLANVYLHYVLDLWCEKTLKKHLKGEVYYVRYADDFLLMFQYENEAKKVMTALAARLQKFGLETAQDKTRILPFGRFKGTKEDFDFLGFTFFNTKKRNGKYRLGVRTSKKKLKAKKQIVKAWLKTRLTKPVAETMELIDRSLTGHNNYYGVNGNFSKIKEFWSYVYHTSYRILNRRSQKKSMSWDIFNRIWNHYVKQPKLTTNIWQRIPMVV
jgi:group II intron reverse transcriptase/maturase